MAAIGLVVFDATALNSADTALRDKLQGWGHTVTVHTRSDAAPTGKAAHVIAPSVTPTPLSTSGAYLPNNTTPVLILPRNCVTPVTTGTATDTTFLHSTYTYTQADPIQTDTVGSTLATSLGDPYTMFSAAQQAYTMTEASIPNASKAVRPVYTESAGVRVIVWYYPSGGTSTNTTYTTFAARRAVVALTDTHLLALTTAGWTTIQEALNYVIGTGAVNPTVNAGADVSLYPGETFQLNATGAGGTGTYAWTQTAGTTTALSSTTVADPTGTAPGTAQTLTYSVTYTVSGVVSPADTVNVVVQPAPTVVVPTSTGTATGWVNVGTAGSIHAALADSLDTTYAESAAAPSSALLVLKYGTVGDPAVSTGYKMRARLSAQGSTTSTVVVELVEAADIATVNGGTGSVRATRTVTNLSATPTTYTWDLTAAEADAIVAHANLYRRYTVTAA